MSDRLPNGTFAPGTSGNPGGKKRGPTLTKTLRLLLEDDTETWAKIREIEQGAPDVEGAHERIKFAVNVLRRSKFDNAVMREVFDRVDGKLAAAYTLPDEDDNTRIIRPILYVAPERPEQAERLFRAFDDDEPEPEAERQAPTLPPVRDEESKPSDTEPFIRVVDVSGRVIERPGPRNRK